MTPSIGAERSVASAISLQPTVLTTAGIASARLDVEILAAAALGISRAQLLTFSSHFPSDARNRFESFVARRIAREPIAYITARKEFFSLDLEVTPAVLIPRPETETLVAATLETLRGMKTSSVLRVLELGTGSGAIALALAINDPRLAIVATDISEAALAVAARNALCHGVADRIRFELADLWPADRRKHRPRRSRSPNPPYVGWAEFSALAPEIIEHEPRLALDGGPDGLGFYRRIATQLPSHLISGGRLLVEVGADQSTAVTRIFERHGATALSTVKDLAGHPRVVAASFGA